MIDASSKRRTVSILIFLLKCFSKPVIIQCLKRDNQLQLFRRLEKCSTKIVNCEGAIEFLRLCQSFGLTPTFVRVDKTRWNKWKEPSDRYQKEILQEELRVKLAELNNLKTKISEIYKEIRDRCSTLRYMCILKMISELRNKQYNEMMQRHTNKISRLLTKELDVDQHIHNISSHNLSFFQKLVICRGLKFAFPQKVSARDVKASFEKAYWKLEPRLRDDKKELASATLRSIAINYIQKKPPRAPKALVRAANQLRNRDDIIVTKPDKADGVVVMNKSDYTRLLKEASINDTTKFSYRSKERPTTRGRPPKHYHPLLEKERHLERVVRKNLPKPTADILCPKSSRLAHLYGLPKTHKRVLSMRPILSATGTYNFQLAKWLDDKLKPLATNSHTIDDIFQFADEIQQTPVKDNDVLVSYDVTALFTNIPVDETIQILADKAFSDDWFNKTHGLQLQKEQLIELLEVAVKDQLFQFDGELYEQTDGVAMGSPLGPLLANTFMCHIEEKLEEDGQMPNYYKRYVDDTFSIMPDLRAATSFLDALNSKHPSLNFTMETATDNTLAFLGMNIFKNGTILSTSVYRKPTNTGLYLHYDSHVDHRYKVGLLKTMLYRAYRLSSTWKAFSDECEILRTTFAQLHYPTRLVDSTIKAFINNQTLDKNDSVPKESPTEKPVIISISFKDQKSADMLKKQLQSLGRKISVPLKPVFKSRKIGDLLKSSEEKPKIVNEQCVVYQFKCGSCDMDYVGYTNRHLHQRVAEHSSLNSSIGKHMLYAHGISKPNLINNFSVIKKCRSKFDCLINEMLVIQELKPSLNVQNDSIRAKLFTS